MKTLDELMADKIIDLLHYILSKFIKPDITLENVNQLDSNTIDKLKQQYENEETDEEDISDEDIDNLCKLYEKETDELNADTERRKNHIAQMLKELKNA